MCKYIERCAILVKHLVMCSQKNVYKVNPYCLDGNEIGFYSLFCKSKKVYNAFLSLKFCFKCIWFVWFYIFPLSCNITNLFHLGTRTVYVAPDTAVYCQCFMPMDVFHDVEKKLSLLLGSTECILFGFHVYITLKTPLELYRQQLLSSR